MVVITDLLELGMRSYVWNRSLQKWW